MHDGIPGLIAICTTLRPRGYRTCWFLKIRHIQRNGNDICKDERRTPITTIMSHPLPTLKTTATLNTHAASHRKPAAVLTIAEHLDAMRAPDQHRPSERCYFNEKGERRWVAVSEIARFLRKHGAKQPSDFESQFHTDWKSNFFSGF